MPTQLGCYVNMAIMCCFRSQLAAAVAWHAQKGFPSTASALSFDGRGYLFTQQFGTDTRFGRSPSQQFVLYLRPNDASRGLVMYAYQPQVHVVITPRTCAAGVK